MIHLDDISTYFYQVQQSINEENTAYQKSEHLEPLIWVLMLYFLKNLVQSILQ